MIKHLLLDLDDTLLDFRASEKVALTKALIKMKVEPTPTLLSRYSVINRGYWERLERGEITRARLLVDRFADLFSEFSVSADPARMQDSYEGYLAMGYTFVDGAKELLDALADTYTLWIASNGNAKVQESRIVGSGISSYFSGIFISEQIGADKPSAAFYDACFARMGDARREETVMVGDSLTSDIRGGAAAGLRTVWYNPCRLRCPGGLSPTAEIHRLSDLPAVLKRI